MNPEEKELKKKKKKITGNAEMILAFCHFQKMGTQDALSSLCTAIAILAHFCEEKENPGRKASYVINTYFNMITNKLRPMKEVPIEGKNTDLTKRGKRVQ